MPEDLITEGESALELLVKAQQAGADLDADFSGLEETQKPEKKADGELEDDALSSEADDDEDEDDDEDDGVATSKPPMAKGAGKFVDATQVLVALEQRLAKADQQNARLEAKVEQLSGAVSSIFQMVKAQGAGMTHLVKAQQSVLNPSMVAKADRKYSIPVRDGVVTAQTNAETFKKAMDVVTDPYVARKIEVAYNEGRDFAEYLTPEQRQSAGL